MINTEKCKSFSREVELFTSSYYKVLIHADDAYSNVCIEFYDNRDTLVLTKPASIGIEPRTLVIEILDTDFTNAKSYKLMAKGTDNDGNHLTFHISPKAVRFK